MKAKPKVNDGWCECWRCHARARYIDLGGDRWNIPKRWGIIESKQSCAECVASFKLWSERGDD